MPIAKRSCWCDREYEHQAAADFRMINPRYDPPLCALALHLTPCDLQLQGTSIDRSLNIAGWISGPHKIHDNQGRLLYATDAKEIPPVDDTCGMG